MRLAALPLCYSYKYLFFGKGPKLEIAALPTSFLEVEQLYHKRDNVSMSKTYGKSLPDFSEEIFLSMTRHAQENLFREVWPTPLSGSPTYPAVLQAHG
jgi:hypothetical protein